MFEISNIIKSERVTDAKEDGKMDKNQVVLVPARWHHFRRRIRVLFEGSVMVFEGFLESLEVCVLVNFHTVAQEQFC